MNGDQKVRVIVLFDGGNTYRKLKEANVLGAGKHISYTKLAELVCEGYIPQSVRYYVGIVKDFDGTEKSKKIVSGQQKFLARLGSDGIDVVKGTIMYDGGLIREKGVDVRMAVDLSVGAADDTYDRAYIFSSDTDLIPAVQYAQSKGKKIVYVSLTNKVSIIMSRVCNSVYQLSDTQLQTMHKKS
jgi:uncharacterized LabA/DUF88 family protein